MKLANLRNKLKQLDLVLEGDFVLSSGERTNRYYDIKKAYGYQDTLNMISKAVWEQMDGRTTCIAAVGYGGISPPSVITSRYSPKLSMIRKEPKGHGLARWIDAYIPTEEDRVSIYDDVFTSGDSIRHMIEVIKPTGAEILRVHVVLRRREGDPRSLGIPLKSLFVPEDLL